jgi:beta-phosphoglucomutase
VAKKIRGVAFDLEGTVVDLERFHFHEGFVPATRELGMAIDFETICTIPNAIGGGDQVIAEGISKLSGGKIDPEKLREVKMRYYNKAIENLDIVPRPGFLEVFSQVVRRHLPVAIGSLTPTSQARVILERSGVGKLFPAGNVVLLEDVRERKPKPDVYLETARRMDIDPKEQLVFEDNATGVKAAIAAGSKAIAMPIFQTTEVFQQLIQAGASDFFLDWSRVDIGLVLRMIQSEIEQ